MGNQTKDGFDAIVASHLAMTTAELPAARDSWYREITYLIGAKDRMWPFLRKEWTLSTVGDQEVYTLDSIDIECQYVESMTILGDRDLVWLGSNEIDRMRSASVAPGNPRYWGSADGFNIRLYPTPTGVEQIAVAGFKKPKDWTVDNITATDMPVEFDEVIVNWAVGRLYHQQEMPTNGDNYQGMAMALLDNLHTLYRGMPMDHPQIIGGNPVYSDTGPFRMKYPWE